MTGGAFALLERLHGHLGLLALALLLHPVLVSRGGRGLRWTAGLGALALVGTTLSGSFLYPQYRIHHKPALFRAQASLGWAFETKEHLAFMALWLGLAGVGCVLLGPASRPLGRRLLALAFGCGLVSAGVGLAVAAGSTPAW